MRHAPQEQIRNFCIIAHIDHGKSTLADRILEFTGAIDPRQMQEQVLDQMDLERERGITIKMTAVRLTYRARDGQEYELNLIDTPGHVDFTYEVSRSLAACEGALLVVDASQGVEAQTIANVNLAMNNGLEIIPVINKIDLPAADPQRVKEEIENILMLDASDAILASAKEGIGTEEILEAVVHKIPPPRGNPNAPLRALIFDSHFDPYLGVVVYIRVVDGVVRPGMRIRFMSTGREFEVTSVGFFTPNMQEGDELRTGEVGYLTAGIKTVGDTRVGDTITDAERPAEQPLPGYKPVKPMVYCGLYPVDGEEFTDLRDALMKLQLNDAALVFEPETSAALGFGFRCGFLGLLHMDIVQERLEREFGLSLIATAPSVVYRITTTKGEVIFLDNPAHWPAPTTIAKVEEPYIRATIFVPSEYVGAMMELAMERRGEFVKMEYPSPNRVLLTYDLPLAEILLDFYDQLKSRSKGYASFDYEPIGYRESELVKLDILINGDPVDALSFITHRDRAYSRGRALVERLREVVPRQQFEVRIQAAIGSKVIAAERIPPFRKNVLAKCYGGDVTRKRKLLEKQKEGKKRMKQLGNVEIPQEAFLSVLKVAE
ncbi:MAG: translation elongation factor 4 [Armatimonadota bacterium]|nr:translation elongation factor 4 [bacterium]MCS7310781.1 translation elongation factor 4 [Armatimonadota bacterium]MDW8104677.1 translation elongation factor 4 [Armatimonadota bacterium]MDW8290596.1 translation elongation factor 4 [Armatimonadota bacterium]